MRRASKYGAPRQTPRVASGGRGLCKWGRILVWASVLLGLWTAIGLAEQAEVEYAKGVLEYSNRNYLDALEHFRRAVTLEPNSADVQFYLGLTHTRLGEFAQAITALERALQLDASKGYIHYHLGLAYLHSQRYEEALTQFQRAAQDDPQKAATQFYLGQTLYQLRRYSEAPVYFQRALELDPALAPRPQYYQGLALYATEQDEQAQAAFTAVMRSAPETDFARQAQSYLDAIAERAGTQRLVELRGTVSFEYDDNVILEPNDIAVSSQADGRTVFNVLGRITPVRTPSWRLGAEYALFQSLHFDLTEFDLQSHTLGLFAQYKRSPVTWHMAANYNYTLVDTAHYSEALTLQPSAVIKETDSLFTFASVRYRRSNFFDSIPPPQDPAVRDRDGWAVRAGAEQYWLLNQRAAVSAGYYFEASRTEGSDWEYNSHELTLGLRLSLGWNLALHVQGSYTRFDYLHDNSFASVRLGVLTAADTRERRDDRLMGIVRIERPLGRHLTLTASYLHTTNFSNIDFFEYNRNILSLALTGRY